MRMPLEFWNACKTYGSQTGADPVLLAAIARHETNYGTVGAGLSGYALGYGVYSESNSDSRFRGLENQLHFAGAQIARDLEGPVTLESIMDFSVNSWKAGDPVAWAKDVWGCYVEIAKEVGSQVVEAQAVEVPTIENVKVAFDMKAVVACFGVRDLMPGIAVGEKVLAPVCSQAQMGLVNEAENVYWIGGPVHTGNAGQTVINLTGEQLKDTMIAVANFL
jgi:hypothetical protein